VALQRRCRASTLAGVGGARDEDLVGAAGQPGHDLGDPGGVAWGRSLGCRPISAMPAVKLGGRPFGELRPALAWRDDLRENGGALDGVRALPAKGRTSRSAAASVGRCDILPADDFGKGKEISLLATFNAQRTGGLAARPGSGRRIDGRTKNGRRHGATTCVCCCRRTGDAVTNRWWDWRCGCWRWARRCVCASRPTGRGEGSER